jgi:3-oxoacyl-(acyl-carrier-protein) synthase
MGIISALGTGISETAHALQKGFSGLRPLTLFPVASEYPLPVGEISGTLEPAEVPRTHQLARIAGDQAMTGYRMPPDAVVLGVTTGGMLTTEAFLKMKTPPGSSPHHGIGSVAEDIARRYRCRGPVVTISTACSSGTVAIKLALEMLRAGLAERVLAGGVDSLCRLTYYGFNSLQLIDPEGARPLDQNRRGMSVAEGAAMMLLATDRPDGAKAEILGAGLSCDAYHPTAPHPRGRGALAAMQAAVKAANIDTNDIDYLNLHGTGTLDNDLSESEAINTLFANQKPPLSSVKGAFGHTLAAAGAIEAVVAATAISESLIPGNIGCRLPDPDLNLKPLMAAQHAPVNCVLSNSFGFGGNNAALVLARPDLFEPLPLPARTRPLGILGYACLTGAGGTEATMRRLSEGKSCQGMFPSEDLSENLPPRIVRRLKRLPRMTLSLAAAAHQDSGLDKRPEAVFLGTGWGAQSETYDFLTGLFDSGERFPSPTDFVGSVHNAPAGQVALHYQSTGANITTSGGDYSFEQALLAAQLLAKDVDGSFFIIGADESHNVLSNMFDPSVSGAETLSDGGSAFCLKQEAEKAPLSIALKFFENSGADADAISRLIHELKGPEHINAAYSALLIGIPGSCRKKGEKQLGIFLSQSEFEHPVIDYRKIIGEFASASAVAAAMAAGFLSKGRIPLPWENGRGRQLNSKGILVVGLGKFLTAMEIFAN